MIKSIKLGLILFTCILSFGQSNVNIKGTAFSWEGKTIKLISYTDLISKTEQIISSQKVKLDGNFDFEISIDTISFFLLRIGEFQGELFLEPNKNYTITFPSENEIPKLNLTYAYNKIRNIELKFPGDISSLNSKINRFNLYYFDFINDNFKSIYRTRNQSIINIFKSETDSLFGINKEPYLEDYITYKIAILEMLASVKSTSSLINQYILNSDIKFNHPQYIDFFNQMFSDYLKRQYLGNKKNEISEAINVNKNFVDLTEYFSDEFNQENRDFRELVCLVGLKYLFYDDDFNKQNILYMIEASTLICKSQENVEIAKNLRHKLGDIYIGANAPEIELKKPNNDIFKLSEQESKYIYLGFWSSENRFSTQDLKATVSLELNYGKKVKFVSICIDDSINNMIQLINENKYKWDIIHFDNNYELLKRYQVYQDPSYILIDRDKKIYSFPAPPPGEELDRLFFTLFRFDE